MKFTSFARFAMILAVLAFSLFPAIEPAARTADAKPLTTASSEPVQATTAAKKESRLVDANSVFFGCAVGATLGALVTAMPPLVGWTLYAGALPSVVAVVATSGVGCTVGLMGGVVLSTLDWVFTRIGNAWRAVFG